MNRTVEGVDLALGDLRILPGLINAHDHLEFALFPRLGQGPYANAQDWARDIYLPDRSPIREHLAVPKHLRLLWGGLRNLMSGVTTVCHHNPYEDLFDQDFPVQVVKHFGWAHSLAFGSDMPLSLGATPQGAPFLIHLGEGTDESSAQELFRLRELGGLRNTTVLIHAVGLDADGWKAVAQAEAAVVWCPQSNLFTLGRTLDLGAIPANIPVALGTDSPLTSCGDLLDELQVAVTLTGHPLNNFLRSVTTVAQKVLRLAPPADDWLAVSAFGEPPEAVVSRGKLLLLSPDLAVQLPDALRRQFHSLHLCGRPPMLVRWNIPELVATTRPHLGRLPLALGGREVML